MNSKLYKIKCLTNLHVGSGDINFHIVDNEVEKDPVTGYPIMHASGIKGALRDAAEKDRVDAGEIIKIFGSPQTSNNSGNSGSCKFFDARLLARPLRVNDCSKMAYINTTTETAIRNFIETAVAFGIQLPEMEPISIDFQNAKFVSTCDSICIEGERSRRIDGVNNNTLQFLKKVLGSDFAICKDLDEYPLPVVARNNLKNPNLWFEEYVPHQSLFWIIILSENDFNFNFSKPIQLGGNASIGNGFVKFEEI